MPVFRGRVRFRQAAFLRGTLAPDLRASLMPMAIACLRLFTFAPPPDFSLPCLYSCIALPTLLCALRLYLRPPALLELLEDERERLDFLAAVEREVPRCDVLLRLPVLELRRRDEVELERFAPDFFVAAIGSSLLRISDAGSCRAGCSHVIETAHEDGAP